MEPRAGQNVIQEALTCCCAPLQQWDINEKLPDEVEGPFHVAVATNVLHTGNNLKSESPFHCLLLAALYACLSAASIPQPLPSWRVTP
jgi:hypothetical protein